MSINTQIPLDCPSCKEFMGSNVGACANCLNYNNQCRLLIANFTTDDEEKAMDRTVNLVEKIAEMSLENLFKFTRHMRSIAAGATEAYQKKLITTRVSDPKSLSKKSNAAEFAQAVKEQREAQRPLKEKKLLTAREKAIKTLTDIGVPEAIAMVRIDAEMSKVGRNPGK